MYIHDLYPIDFVLETFPKWRISHTRSLTILLGMCSLNKFSVVNHCTNNNNYFTRTLIINNILNKCFRIILFAWLVDLVEEIPGKVHGLSFVKHHEDVINAKPQISRQLLFRMGKPIYNNKTFFFLRKVKFLIYNSTIILPFLQ